MILNTFKITEIRHRDIKIKGLWLLLMLVLISCGVPMSPTLNTSPYQISGMTQPGEFSVDRLQLEFSTGYSRITVTRGQLVRALARIKFRGQGNLQALWLLDERIIDQVNINLNHGSDLVLSLKNPVDSRSLSAGNHRIKLIINRPGVPFQLPEIEFFVTSGK